MTDDWSLIERALEVAARLYDPQAPGVESDLDRMEEAVAALGRLCEQAESAEKKARAAGDSCVRLGLRFLTEQKRAEAAEAERDEWKQACDACLSNGLRIAAERDAYKKASETLGREVARLLDRFNVELDAAALGVSEPSVVAADLEATE